MSAAAPNDARVAALAGLAAEADLDAIVATKDASIAYLTGMPVLQLERLFAVVVRADGRATIVAPELDRDGVTAAPTSCDASLYTAASNGLPELLDALGGARRIGVEEDHLTHGRGVALGGAGLEVVPAAATVMRLRAVKDDAEVAAIRAACVVIGELIEELFAELRPGAVEREVNALVEYRLRSRGATAAHPLVLFGDHSSQPHGEPGPRELAVGDVVCADVSACFDGYWGDLTRCGTVGPPGEWAQRAWNVVREAYDAAVAATRPGARARDVDAAQRNVVTAAPELGACLHGAGHAIGMEVHEAPFLVPSSADVLEAGTVLTIEPGIYRTGQGGIRLEDDVLVGPDGPVLLSHLPLELRAIPADRRAT